MLGLCALSLIFASCDSSGGSDSETIPDATTITNGDFESCLDEDSDGYIEPTGWDVSVGDETSGWGTYPIEEGGSSDDSKYYLQISNWSTDTGKNPNQNILNANATQTVVLYAGSYTATVDVCGATTGDGTSLVFSAVAGDATLDYKSVSVNNEWSKWDTLTITFNVEDSYAYVTLGVTGTLESSAYCKLDNMTLSVASEAEE